MADIGRVSVGVVPSAKSFVSDLRAQILPEASKLGDSIGNAMAQRITAKLRDAIGDGLAEGTATTKAQGSKSGDDYGSAFAKAVQTRFKAALESLPEAKLSLDASEADQRLAALRTSIDSLSKSVGIDISDEHALEAVARIKAQLEDLQHGDNSIDVRVNAGAASAELAALQAQLDKLSGVSNTGVTGGGGSAGGLPGFLSPGLFTALAAGVTLVGPVVGAGTAALVGFAGAAGIAGLAYKGFQSDLASGNSTGLAVKAQLTGLSGELHNLEQVAANGLEGGVLDSLSQVHAFLPALDGEVQTLAGDLGTALNIGTGGTITALQVMQPLLDEGGKAAEYLAQQFADFAASDKFAQFVSYAEQELPKVGKDLEDIGAAGITVVSDLQPLGDFFLSLVDDISKAVTLLDSFKGKAQALTSGANAGGGSNSPTANQQRPNFFGRLINEFRSNDGTQNPLQYANSAPDLTGTLSATSADRLSASQTAAANAQAVADTIKSGLAGIQAQYGLTNAQADSFTKLLGVQSAQVTTGAVALSSYKFDLASVATAENQATASTTQLLAAYDAFASSEGTAADRANLIGQILKASNGDALGYAGSLVGAATANQQFVDTFDQARDSAKQAHTAFSSAATGVVDLTAGTINYKNAAAGPMIQALQGLQDAAVQAAGAIYQHELATKGGAVAAQDATDQYYAQTHGALIDEAKQLGLTKDQAKKLADNYFNIQDQGDIKTQITAVGADATNTILSNILEVLDDLDGKKVSASVVLDYQQRTDSSTLPLAAGAANIAARNRPGNAAGGLISGPGTGTSDSILARLSDGEFVSTAEATNRNAAALAAGNQGAMLLAVPGFESGGFVGVTAPTNTAATKAAAAVSKLSSQQGTIRITISQDLTKVLNSALGTVDAVQSSFASLISEVNSSIASHVGSSALVKQLEGENNELVGLANQRTTLLQQITDAQNKYNQDIASFNSENSSVTSSIAGNFNIAGLGSSSGFDPFAGAGATGSVADAITQLQGEATGAGTFQANLAKLKSLGLSPQLIQQLAEAGVSGGGNSAALLVGASSSQIAQINKLSGAVNNVAAAGGQQIASSLFGSTIRSDAATLNGLDNQLISNEKTAATIADAVAAAIGKLKVQVNGTDQFAKAVQVLITQNEQQLATAARYYTS